MTTRRLPLAIVTLCGVLLAIACVLALAARHQGVDLLGPQLLAGCATLAYPLVGAIVASRRPQNPIGWILLGIGVATALRTLVQEYAVYGIFVRPQGLPWSHAAAIVANASWLGGQIIIGIVFVALLFPDGRLPSPRWRRPVLWLMLPSLVLASADDWLAPDPLSAPFDSIRNPLALGFVQSQEWITIIAPIVFLGFIVAAGVSLVGRLRRARGLERRQLVCFVAPLTCGAVLAVLAWAIWLVGADRGGVVLGGAVLCALVAIPVAIGVAILRYRLYDLDRFVTRSLVYGAVTAVLVGAYAAVMLLVIGPSLDSGSGFAISLVAAIGVAVVFGPLRRRLQDAIDVRFGWGAGDPYVELANLGRELGVTSAHAAALELVVDTARRAFRVPYAAIDLEHDGAFEPAASQGAPAGELTTVPLGYAGVTVGRLTIGKSDLTETDRRLLVDLSRQAAIAAHAARLTGDLQRSRERLVAAREEERRRLRRDLHDGLGPTLAGMLLQLDAADLLVDSDPARADTVLVALKHTAQQGIDDIRRLVYELRPPALDDLGLIGAIERQTGLFPGLSVSVLVPSPIGELPAAVEVAAYRIVVEALTNVARHADARRCTVQIARNGGLELEVSDDGIGLPDAVVANVGLGSMRERAAELGGTCTIACASSGGTRVHALIPIPAV